jgi:hypothetical protein
VAERGIVRGDNVVGVREPGIRLRNMREEEGKPCSRSTAGALSGPASREKTLMPPMAAVR